MEQFILPVKVNLVPAWGTALSEYGDSIPLSELRSRIKDCKSDGAASGESALPPIFKDVAEYESWKKDKADKAIARAEWRRGAIPVVIGIDSGSTTTKLVVLDAEGKLLFTHYHDNDGNPVSAVRKALEELRDAAVKDRKSVV